MELFVPIEHKGQACFITPPLNFSLHLKEKSSPNLINNNNLIDQQNQQNLQNQSNQLNHQNHSNHQNHQNQPTQSSKHLNYQKIAFEAPHLQSHNLDDRIKNDQDELNGYDPYRKIKTEASLFDLKRTAPSISPLSFSPSIPACLNFPQSNNQNAFDINDIRLKMTNLSEVNGQISPDKFINLNHYQLNQLGNLNLNHQFNLNNSNNLNSFNQFNGLKSPVGQASFQLKRGSGRKPLNSKEDRLTPEEEEKRKQRRMRNKEAAARCRKRRVEHTSKLEHETDGLESKRKSLQEQARKLREANEQLLTILKCHDCKIRMQKIN